MKPAPEGSGCEQCLRRSLRAEANKPCIGTVRGHQVSALVRGSKLSKAEETSILLERTESNKALREKENLQALGGLRNPARAVGRSLKLQMAGARIQKVLLPVSSAAALSTLEIEPTNGFEESLVKTASVNLCKDLEWNTFRKVSKCILSTKSCRKRSIQTRIYEETG